MKKLTIVLISLSVTLSGCMTSTETSMYVSPLEFKDYNCKQIKKEMVHTSSLIDQATKTNQSSEVLGAAIMAYGISQGYGFGSGGDNGEVARLRSKYEALHQVSIEKNCD